MILDSTGSQAASGGLCKWTSQFKNRIKMYGHFVVSWIWHSYIHHTTYFSMLIAFLSDNFAYNSVGINISTHVLFTGHILAFMRKQLMTYCDLRMCCCAKYKWYLIYIIVALWLRVLLCCYWTKCIILYHCGLHETKNNTS